MVSEDGNTFTSSLLNPGIRQDSMLFSTVLDKLKNSQNPLENKGMLRVFTSVAMLSWGYSIIKVMICDGMNFVLTDPM